jgi:hypothetical protein
MLALNTLLVKAFEAGIARNTATIQQQLQQSGMLQQLSAVLAAMTAKLQAETAVLAAGGWDAASGGLQQFTAAYAFKASCSHTLLPLRAYGLFCGSVGCPLELHRLLIGCGAPPAMQWW